jgi:hypothetical protein
MPSPLRFHIPKPKQEWINKNDESEANGDAGRPSGMGTSHQWRHESRKPERLVDNLDQKHRSKKTGNEKTREGCQQNRCPQTAHQQPKARRIFDRSLEHGLNAPLEKHLKTNRNKYEDIGDVGDSEEECRMHFNASFIPTNKIAQQI